MSFANSIKQLDWRVFLLIGTAFFLPVSKTIAPFFVLFLIIEWVISKRWKIPFFDKTYLIFFSLYYFYLLFSMIWSENQVYGWQDLGSKTTYFFMPLLLGVKDKNLIYKKILEWFIYGTFLLIIIDYAHGFSLFLESGETKHFFYSDLSPQFHVAYASMYSVFALIAAYYLYVRQYKYFKNIWITSLIVLVESVHVNMLNSKASFIAMMVVFLLLFLWFLQSKYFKSFIVPALGVLGVTIGLLFGSTFIYQRFFGGFEFMKPKSEQVISNKVEQNHTDSPAPVESSMLRIVAWDTAIEIIKKNPFGVGVGDRKDVFVDRLAQKGHHNLKAKGINTHNQYLQVLLAVGIPGLMIFLINLFYPIIEAFKKRNFLLICFIVNIAINIIFESMLEVQAGIIFYTFFAVLLVKQMKETGLTFREQ